MQQPTAARKQPNGTNASKNVQVPHASLSCLTEKIEAQPKASLEHSMATFATPLRATRRPRSHEYAFECNQIKLSTSRSLRSRSHTERHANLATSNTLFATAPSERIGQARVQFPANVTSHEERTTLVLPCWSARHSLHRNDRVKSRNFTWLAQCVVINR